MADYRPIQIKIWHDDWFCSLNPEERCLWIFLLSNEFMHISGIYELPKPLISPLSGCPKGLEIFEDFIKQGKIKYKNGWVMLCNYLKNNGKQRSKIDNITKSIITYFSENLFLIEYFNLNNEVPYKHLISPLQDPTVKGKAKRVKGKDNTVVKTTPSLKLGNEIYSMDELTYEPIDAPKSKSKYGRQTMAVLARKYAELTGIEISGTFDASEWAKPLGKIYQYFGKNPDKAMEYMERAINYFRSKELSFKIHTIADSIPDTERLIKESAGSDQLDVSERRRI